MHPLFCAIDTTDLDRATRTISAVASYVGGIKLGLEFFTRHGADGVRRVMPEGTPLFLDLKLHDIPNTVAGAVRALEGLNIHLLTVHACGGEAMMSAARDAAQALSPRPRIVGVTVLTSMDEADVHAVGVSGSIAAQVQRLGELALRAGIDGAVCSPREIAALRAVMGKDSVLVVPGIRPAGSAHGDQKRVMTPKEALALGATYLVIGRPITDAPDPARAAREILESL